MDLILLAYNSFGYQQRIPKSINRHFECKYNLDSEHHFPLQSSIHFISKPNKKFKKKGKLGITAATAANTFKSPSHLHTFFPFFYFIENLHIEASNSVISMVWCQCQGLETNKVQRILYYNLYWKLNVIDFKIKLNNIYK